MSSPTLDLDFVRDQFPAFSDPRTARWIHLENAGGSYAPHQVVNLLTDIMRTKVQPYWPAGPSARLGAAMDRARGLVPATLGAQPDEVSLGPSTSQNTYVLAQAFAGILAPGDEVIVTDQDHEANSGVWRRLAERGVTVYEWKVDPATGLLDPGELIVGERTRLLAVTHASNLAATVNPVAELATRLHAVGGVIVVDGVSYAPHAAVDVEALGVDVYLYSAYKTYGPHVGVMYVRPELMARLPNQYHDFNDAKPTERLVPAGPDHAAVAACAGMVDYYADVYRHHLGDPDAVEPTAMVRAVFDLFARHEERLLAPLVALLTDRDGVRLLGAPSADHAVRAPTVAFHSERRSSAEIQATLAGAGIGAAHGSMYAPRLVRAVGLDPADGVVRLSAVHYTTVDEIHRACEVLDPLL